MTGVTPDIDAALRKALLSSAADKGTLVTEPQIAEIAAKLTAAQKRTVMEGRLYYGRGYWPLYHALREKDLVAPMFGHPLTAKGLAVAAYLKEQSNADRT